MISTWVMIIGTDLLIAVTMFYSLYAYRKQSVFRRFATHLSDIPC